jgi:hypothetical protein
MIKQPTIKLNIASVKANIKFNRQMAKISTSKVQRDHYNRLADVEESWIKVKRKRK